MTPERQREVLAELDGFTWYRIPGEHIKPLRGLFLPELLEYPDQSPEWKMRADGTEAVCNWEYMAKEGYVPDYLHDRNAMNALLLKTPAGHEGVLLYKLTRLLHLDEYLDGRGKWLLLTAPLDKIAESIIKAYGRWEEE